MALNVPPQAEDAKKSVQVRKYIFLIRRRWFVIVFSVLVCVALASFDIWRTPVAYRATTQVFVTTSDVKDASGLFSGNQFAQSRVQTYVSVVTSPSIVDPVRSELRLDLSSRQLTQRITVDAPLNKTLINIHVRDGSAVRAAEIANAVTVQFIAVVSQIETEKAGTATQSATPVLKLTVIHPAIVPGSPVAPQKKLLLLLGLFGGLFLGLSFVIVREWLNNRLRSPLDVQAISALPLLGVIPADRRTKSQPNAFKPHTASPRSEAFRLLRTNLQFVRIDNPPRVIAITSPVGGEGKTTVALNLAASLAEVGFRVGLIETNLREPVLARWLGLDREIGLTSLLRAEAEIGEAVQHVDGELWVLTSGRLPPNPTELLGSKTMRATISALAEQFDYLILDASPLLLADGAEVVSLAAAAVLVVGAERTTRAHFWSAVSAISQVGGAIAGVVVNRSSDLKRPVRTRRTVPPRGRARSSDDVTPTHDMPVRTAVPATSQSQVHDNDERTPTHDTPVEREARAAAQSATRRRIGQRRPKTYNPTSAQAAAVVSSRDAGIGEHDRDGDDSESDSGSWLLGK